MRKKFIGLVYPLSGSRGKFKRSVRGKAANGAISSKGIKRVAAASAAGKTAKR